MAITANYFTEENVLRDHIWREKFKYVKDDGSSDEVSILDTFTRVFDGVFALDHDTNAKKRLLELTLSGVFMPAGRIISGAGTDKPVTYVNCFTSGVIRDAMAGEHGIMRSLEEAAVTQQKGGGIGFDFSTIRPAGALVKGFIPASGVIPFMDSFDAVCRTVMSSGSRRGAMLGALRIDHPDIWNPNQYDVDPHTGQLIQPSFISAKRQSGRLTNFNISVTVTDEFMKALDNDDIWHLGFPVPPIQDVKNNTLRSIERNGNPWYIFRSLKARELWDSITRNAYDHAEPGVLFIDTINKANNLNYCETIATTNPCFSADTLVVTKKGAYPIKALVGKKVSIWDNKKWRKVDNFRVTGTNQPMLKVTLEDGSSFRCTPYHTLYLDSGKKVEAKDLRVGQFLEPSDVRYDGKLWESAAYLKGFALGDGFVNNEHKKPGLHLYEPKFCCASRLISSASEVEVTSYGTNYVEELGFNVVESTTKWNLTGLTVRRADLMPWFHKYKARLPRRVFRWDRATKCEFLAGLFDADGTAMDSKNGFGYQLSSIEHDFLADIQTLLKSIGVRSKLAVDCKKCWRLSISQASAIQLAQQVEFSRLTSFADREVKYSLKSRYTKVRSVESDGVDSEVYCCTNPPHHKVAIATGVATGQCSEQPLPPHGACNLSAVNLATLVKNPFTTKAFVDYPLLKEVVFLGVRFLDNVLDITKMPLPEQQEESRLKRRIGLGISGLGNFLQKMCVRYGSEESLKLIDTVLSEMANWTYQASAQLAYERGTFPLYNKLAYEAAPFVQNLSDTTKEKIAKHGLRNGVLLTVAPTGTTSILFNNISSGVEPTFAWSYFRKIRKQDDNFIEFEVQDHGFKDYCDHVLNGNTPPKNPDGSFKFEHDYMVTALELSVDAHLLVQAACQKWIDSSLSKTANIPVDYPFEDFQNFYKRAYELGIKGTTTYRPNALRGSILSTEKQLKDNKEPATTIKETKPLPNTVEVKAKKMNKPERPKELDGKTYKIKWGVEQPRAYYITINDVVNEYGQRLPFEIFINSKAVENLEFIVSLTRMISGIFRKAIDNGDDISFIIEELQQVYSPLGGQWAGGKYLPSLSAYIGTIIQEHLRIIGYHDTAKDRLVDITTVNSTDHPKPLGEVCPKCFAPSLIRKEGCQECLSCGFSKCG